MIEHFDILKVGEIDMSLEEAEKVLLITKRELGNTIPNDFEKSVNQMIKCSPEFSNVYLKAKEVLWSAILVDGKIDGLIKSFINDIRDKLHKFQTIDLISFEKRKLLLIKKGFNRQFDRDW